MSTTKHKKVTEKNVRKIEPEHEIVECPDCEGEGTIYIDTSHSCTKTPWQECCGGCGYDEKCEKCDGSGEIENEEE